MGRRETTNSYKREANSIKRRKKRKNLKIRNFFEIFEKNFSVSSKQKTRGISR